MTSSVSLIDACEAFIDRYSDTHKIYELSPEHLRDLYWSVSRAQSAIENMAEERAIGVLPGKLSRSFRCNRFML